MAENNINPNIKSAYLGMDSDMSTSQKKEGVVNYALNANIENFDENSVSYQNEQANELCLVFPEDYQLIGKYYINERRKHLFFLCNPNTNESEIGYMNNNDCQYHTLINADCLNFSIDYPIHKVVHRNLTKICTEENFSTEIFWTDALNHRRYMNIDAINFIHSNASTPCNPIIIDGVLDCNAIKVQPNFSIPQIKTTAVLSDGSLQAGTYQFAVQYGDELGNGYSSYYSITNPLPIFDPNIITKDFNYFVGKSIRVKVSNLDITSLYRFYNLAVIKTINNISSVELVGTYFIDKPDITISYTGQNVTQINLSMQDIFEKKPFYEVADDVTVSEDTIIWKGLTSLDKLNLQPIANKIKLEWETYELDEDEDYSDELLAEKLRGFLRDEVYALEFCALFDNGKQSEGFHVPGPEIIPTAWPVLQNPLIQITPAHNDYVGSPNPILNNGNRYRWEIYNYATLTGNHPSFGQSHIDIPQAKYFQYGEFALWESAEVYPCETSEDFEVWGDLAGKPIRHHKFPDTRLVPLYADDNLATNFLPPPIGTPIGSPLFYDTYNNFQQKRKIRVLGIKVNPKQIYDLIQASTLTAEEKNKIVGFKILRGDRGTNKSIVAKGILRNVGSYNRKNFNDNINAGDKDFLYANYPYNDIGTDPFILDKSNSFEGEGMAYLIYKKSKEPVTIVYTDISTGIENTFTITGTSDFDASNPTILDANGNITNTFDETVYIHKNVAEILSLKRPYSVEGLAVIGPANFDIFALDGTYQNHDFEDPTLITCFSDTLLEKSTGSGSSNSSGFANKCSAFPLLCSFFTTSAIFDFFSTYVPSITNLGSKISGIKSQIIWDGMDCAEITCTQWAVIPVPVGSKQIEVFSEGSSPNNNTYYTSTNRPHLFGETLAEEYEPCSLHYGHISYEIDDRSIPNIAVIQDNVFRINPRYGVGTMNIYTKGGFNKITSIIKPRRSKLKMPVSKNIEFNTNQDNKYHQIFNSPETSFGNPFLGSILKTDNVYLGKGKANFVDVEDNAKYRLISFEAQTDIAKAADDESTDSATFFAIYTAYLAATINSIHRLNFAMSYNSIMNYNGQAEVPINNTFQRDLDYKKYLIPYTQSLGTVNNKEFVINNWQRESSVYLRTDMAKTPFAFPDTYSGNIKDKSRFTLSDRNLKNQRESEEFDIQSVVYYATLKNDVKGQWGQIYSYQTIDTGYQYIFPKDLADLVLDQHTKGSVFGGDTFVSRFGFKTKLPFFTDNGVGSPDDRDMYYDEIGNVGFPKYWHSARSIYKSKGNLPYFFATKAHKFDNEISPALTTSYANIENSYGTYRTFYRGKYYVFAYGIPYFYVESSYNLDDRQAFNNKEGEFYPHVQSNIPNDWLQEKNVSIAQDNTYYYNATYSKQNKENIFTHLPLDWKKSLCNTVYPYRVQYSEPHINNADIFVNNWLIYKPLSYFDFPQNYGKFTSIDGIDNKGVLARFENKALLYNQLLTMSTSQARSAYLGNPDMFKTPAQDFGETDLGYLGSQHKFLLRVPGGQITVDAKRGKIFLISGSGVQELTGMKYQNNRFFTHNLRMEILDYFPNCFVDNHFNGIGVHGVYDANYNRVIFTKLDYIPLDTNITYDAALRKFFLEDVEVFLVDTTFFRNRSFTISFNFNTASWISFHSYIPNFYIGDNTFFYSGINDSFTDFDGSLVALVGDSNKIVPKTTTTSTTTTTIIPEEIPEYNCNIEGYGLELDSIIEGFAIIEQEPCIKPKGMISYALSPVYTSLENACNNRTIIMEDDHSYEELTLTNAQFESLTIGNLVYDEDSDDCALVDDGWYFYIDGTVLSIVNNRIDEIYNCSCMLPTPEINEPQSIAECCGIVFSKEDKLYLKSEEELIDSYYTEQDNISLSETRLIGSDNNLNLFTFWNIALDPFCSLLDYSISYPTGFTSSSGFIALNNNTLIGVNTINTPNEVVQIDLSTNPATFTVLFALDTGITAIGNPLVTLENKFITLITTGSQYYIQQYDMSTFVKDIEKEITTFIPIGIYECNCVIYIVSTAGTVFAVSKSDPLSFIEVIPLTIVPDSITQLQSCVTDSLTTSLNNTTSTTTTTLEPTDNLLCYWVEVEGHLVVSYLDEDYIQVDIEANNGDILSICAQQNSIFVSDYISESGNITINGGETTCIDNTSCITTSTTTTTIP